MYVILADGQSAAGLTARDRQRGDWRPPGRMGRLDWLGGTGGTDETGGRRAVRARTITVVIISLWSTMATPVATVERSVFDLPQAYIYI